MLFTEVDPDGFLEPARQYPPHGRGSWTKLGIGFDSRYRLNPALEGRIGSLAQRGLDYWAVAAGSFAIQERLVRLGYLGPVAANEQGIFGPRTDAAVRDFQRQNDDPDTGSSLAVDGVVGRSTARALFTPLIDAAEDTHGIPEHYLRGECNHESALDPGAVGYYIYYSSGVVYRGVDRGAFQINAIANKQVSWAQAYDFAFAADWSAARLRAYYDKFAARYPGKDEELYWQAAILAHNNPAAAGRLASSGVMDTGAGAAYVNGVLTSIY